MPSTRDLLTTFDLTPREAIQLQERISTLIEREDRLGPLRTVAGADMAMVENIGFAVVILYSFPELQEVERVTVTGDLTFPYVPGLLSFREIPLLLEAFNQLRTHPSFVLADAHGWAHPRRAGMASHLGLALDIPTIGCAKSVLIGKCSSPGMNRGSVSALRDRGERIGTVLRSRTGVRPIYVSCGHRISLRTSVRLTLACCDGYRIPKPLREADRLTKLLRRNWQVNRFPVTG